MPAFVTRSGFMPSRDMLLTIAGKVSGLPSFAAVKTISSECKSISATAYRCPKKDKHLTIRAGSDVEGQVVPALVLDAGSFCAFANDPKIIDKARPATSMAGKDPISG